MAEAESKSRPILFSAPMVRALLAGTKTQTRRIMKPQPELQMNGFYHLHNRHGGLVNVAEEDIGAAALDYVRWEKGDTLWVKETWRTGAQFDHLPPRDLDPVYASPVGYYADEAPGSISSTGKTRVSIFMPRWASRISLRVTDVRVERLQAISPADAEAEGIEVHAPDVGVYRDHAATNEEAARRWDGYRVRAYRCVWEAINGASSWDANPWVVAITFEPGERK